MTPTTDIRAAVYESLAEVAPEADPATHDAARPLAEQVELDSIDFLSFLTGIADRTGVEVPEDEYANIATLDQMVAFVEGAAAV